MKEVEVKAKVKNLKELEEKLVRLGCKFGEVLNDKNKIFVSTDRDFAEFQTDANFVRIRNRNGKIILTLKRPLSNELDCIEKEVIINDAEEMQGILELSGYHFVIEYSGKRRKTKYQDMTICLDELEELGSFVEVEKMTEEEDSGQVQKELFEFLKTLGVKEEDRVTRGYDTLCYLKREGRVE